MVELYLAVILLCKDVTNCVLGTTQTLHTTQEACAVELHAQVELWSAKGFGAFGQCMPARLENVKDS